MAINRRWAQSGIKTEIPETPQGDDKVNYEQGFTEPYRTPIKDGGEPITMGTFNQLMYDITDNVITNAENVTALTERIDNIGTEIIDDNQTTLTTTWSSIKITTEIGSGGGGTAVIDDSIVSPDKVWSSYKTNEMVKAGRTISVSDWETTQGNEDATIQNTTANAKMVNLSVKVKTNLSVAAAKYLGDIAIYYNDTSTEVLRQSCVSQNVPDTTDLTTAIGMTMLDAQDSLIIKGEPAEDVTDFWDNVTIIGHTAGVTGSAPEPTPTGDGLTFTAIESNSTIKLTAVGSPTPLTLEYQTTIADETSEWADYTIGTTITLQADDKVVFRNKTSQDSTQTDTDYHKFVMSGKIEASDSIMYLWKTDGSDFAFNSYDCFSLFKDCSALTKAPELPATNLTEGCYSNMFENCTNLTTAPELPATTLVMKCYYQMFKGCSKLYITETTGENEFFTCPSTTGITDAVTDMFAGTGSEFTGTPTANNNYFYNLASATYEGLTFIAQEAGSSVTLERVGSPSNITLEYKLNSNNWTDYVIANTISLQNIGDKVAFRNKSSQNIALTSSNYFKFTMSGKIIAKKSVNYLYRNDGSVFALNTAQYYGLFLGCSSLIQPPELPTTTLAGQCYHHMFEDCTNLIQTPSLPATTLAERCYASMFQGCTSLTTAPVLPVTTLANNCYIGMFQGCTSLTTAPVLPATTLTQYCYAGMFLGCTSLTQAPALPATTLAQQCYMDMFNGCSSLKIRNTSATGATKIFTCPAYTPGTANPVYNMFKNTGGTYTSDPATGDTYYWYL